MSDIFNDPEFSRILFVIFLIVLSHLLSFLLALFYKKFRFKKLWLSLWIAVFGALVSGYVFLLYINDGGAFNGVFSPALPFVAMLSYIFSFIACGFFGRAFDTKKIWHRWCVPFVVIAPLFIFLFFAWSLMVHPYAEISDEPLEQNDLAASHDDYEMFMSEFKWMSESRWVRWDDDSRTVAFRERNDSVFFKFSYDMCAYTHYDYAARKLESQHGGTSDGEWILLDSEKSAIVRNLKRSVENYSHEFSPAWGIEGYASTIVLKDYKRKTQRRLHFSNAQDSRVYDAMTIEKTFENFMPPRETYTTLSYKEIAKKCNEPRNAFVDSTVQEQQK